MVKERVFGCDGENIAYISQWAILFILCLSSLQGKTLHE
jgi:hypothetical protein